MHSKLARPSVIKRAEQSTFGDVEGGSLQIPAIHRCVYVPILIRAADFHGEVASMDLNILVTVNAVDIHLPGKHSSI